MVQYNGQLGAVKAELAAAAAGRLEHERQGREAAEAEAVSARTRLAGALQEAERCQAALADAEKSLLRQRDETQRLRDKNTSRALCVWSPSLTASLSSLSNDRLVNFVKYVANRSAISIKHLMKTPNR